MSTKNADVTDHVGSAPAQPTGPAQGATYFATKAVTHPYTLALTANPKFRDLTPPPHSGLNVCVFYQKTPIQDSIARAHGGRVGSRKNGFAVRGYTRAVPLSG